MHTEDERDERYEHAAKLAWDTYSEAIGGKAFNGDPLPTWEALVADPSKEKIANAWREVAVALIPRIP